MAAMRKSSSSRRLSLLNRSLGLTGALGMKHMRLPNFNADACNMFYEGCLKEITSTIQVN